MIQVNDDLEYMKFKKERKGDVKAYKQIGGTKYEA